MQITKIMRRLVGRGDHEGRPLVRKAVGIYKGCPYDLGRAKCWGQ
jgi:hypothetical protein